MLEGFREVPERSTEKRRNRLPSVQPIAPKKHADAARRLWPDKTAAEWAARSGVKERMAKYWLAGRPVSGDGKIAIAREYLD
jgi:hypothetical protein